METPKNKPHTNIGSFLKPDQKDHADKVYEFLKADNITVLQQIEKLQADKNEMIEKLEEIYGYLGSYFDGEKVSIGELIKKHKQ